MHFLLGEAKTKKKYDVGNSSQLDHKLFKKKKLKNHSTFIFLIEIVETFFVH